MTQPTDPIFASSRRHALVALCSACLSGCGRPPIYPDTPGYIENFSEIYVSPDLKFLLIRAEYDYIFTLPAQLRQQLTSKFRPKLKALFNIFTLDKHNNMVGMVLLYIDENQPLSASEKEEAAKRHDLTVGSSSTRFIEIRGTRYKPAEGHRSPKALGSQKLNKAYQVHIAEVDHPQAPQSSPVRVNYVEAAGFVVLLGLAVLIAAPFGGLCFNCK